jgi:hypothetical protein
LAFEAECLLLAEPSDTGYLQAVLVWLGAVVVVEATVFDNHSGAISVVASVRCSASVPVVAGYVQRVIDANTRGRLARVGCTRVCIVAILWGTGDADGLLTGVADGARVSVFASAVGCLVVAPEDGTAVV